VAALNPFEQILSRKGDPIPSSKNLNAIALAMGCIEINWKCGCKLS
jgi:hypothetical protein